MRATMASRCGPIFGRSQISVTSTCAMTPPLARDQFGGMAQEPVGRGAAPLRIARRKMHADIAGADRAEHGVGQRVQAGIGVGMADQAMVVRHLDAAEPDMIARAEGVDIETLAGADIAEPRSDAPLGLARDPPASSP